MPGSLSDKFEVQESRKRAGGGGRRQTSGLNVMSVGRWGGVIFFATFCARFSSEI